jgi:hypothetical protein
VFVNDYILRKYKNNFNCFHQFIRGNTVLKILLWGTLACLPNTVYAQTSETPSEPLAAYTKAHETGNGDFIRQSFHKDARIFGYMRGNFVSWSVEEYAARFSGKPADDEAQRKRSIEIIDLTADAAVGKVTLDYPTVRFTDYMALLKVNGAWKIMNKSFHAEPRNAAPN